MRRIPLHFFIWLVTLTTVLVGCSRQPGLVPVEGVLTFDGKPLGGATVFLVSDGGMTRTATGTTRENGAFRMATFGADGVSPGKYRTIVTVVTAGPEPTGESAGGTLASRERAAWQKTRNLAVSGKLSIPPVYGDPSTTPLRCTVPLEGKLLLDLHHASR